MNSPPLDILLALLRPAARSEEERVELIPQLQRLFDFCQFVTESKPIEVHRKESELEIRNLRYVGHSLLDLPAGTCERNELLGKARLLYASHLEAEFECIHGMSKTKGRPPAEGRAVFIQHCLEFLIKNGKEASMHRCGRGTKFVQALWAQLNPHKDEISHAAWSLYWRNHLKSVRENETTESVEQSRIGKKE